MPIQVTCPSCNATLKTADSSAGKRAKCPKCDGILQIPERVAPEGDYELEDPPAPYGAFTDDELANPAATADDRRPCPACGEMIPRKAIKCRFCGEVLDRSMQDVLASAGDVSDPAWQKVRAGLALMYYSIVTIFAAVILMVIGGMIMAGLAAAGGGGALAAGMIVVVVIFGVVIFGAAVASLVGQVRCTAAPEASGARGYAIGAAVCLVGNIILSMIGVAMQSEPVQGVGSLLSMIGSILFILFIRRAAAYLGDDQLAGSAGRFLIFGIAVFVGAVVLGVLSVVLEAPAVIAIVVIAAIICGLVAFVWYLNLIKGLMTTIDQAMGRA